MPHCLAVILPSSAKQAIRVAAVTKPKLGIEVENGVAAGEALLGLDAGEDRRIERSDISVCALDATIQLALEEPDSGGRALVFQRGLRRDRSHPCRHQFGKLVKRLRCRRTRRGHHQRGKQCQHAGIEPVGLGEDALCHGEHPYPERVDDGDRDRRGRQAALDMAMPLAGSLDHNQGEVEAHEPTLEPANPVARVGDAQLFVAGQQVDVEPIFADIDSHVRLGLGLLFGRFLALHAGRAPYHLLRTRAEGRTDHAHPRCQAPRGKSGPGHPRRGRWPPTPTHLTACADSASPTCKGVTMFPYRTARAPSSRPSPPWGEGVRGTASLTN